MMHIKNVFIFKKVCLRLPIHACSAMTHVFLFEKVIYPNQFHEQYYQCYDGGCHPGINHDKTKNAESLNKLLLEPKRRAMNTFNLIEKLDFSTKQTSYKYRIISQTQREKQGTTATRRIRSMLDDVWSKLR
jgi:hypothetical protein